MKYICLYINSLLGQTPKIGVCPIKVELFTRTIRPFIVCPEWGT